MTDAGSEHIFDEVVMTAPLGWLQQNKHTFTPSLPTQFSKAIDSIGYGCLEKVYFSFPSPFWDTTEKKMSGFSQWLSPTYAPRTNKTRYNQEGVELSSLPEEVSHPTLLFYIYGAQSQDLSSQISALETSNPSVINSDSSERRDFLTQWFLPYISKLPGYEAENENCVPISAYFTNWIADDLAGNGSYSNFPIVDAAGKELGHEHEIEQTLDKDIEIIRDGLPGRGVWFAGEHTSPFVALGTVTGAWWSGEGVAERIAEAYGVEVELQGLQGDLNARVGKDKDKEKEKEINFRGFADGVVGGSTSKE